MSSRTLHISNTLNISCHRFRYDECVCARISVLNFVLTGLWLCCQNRVSSSCVCLSTLMVSYVSVILTPNLHFWYLLQYHLSLQRVVTLWLWEGKVQPRLKGIQSTVTTTLQHVGYTQLAILTPNPPQPATLYPLLFPKEKRRLSGKNNPAWFDHCGNLYLCAQGITHTGPRRVFEYYTLLLYTKRTMYISYIDFPW